MSAPPPNDVPSSLPAPHYQPLVIVLAAAAIGILLDQYCPLPLGIWWTIALGGLAAWVGLSLRRRLHTPAKLLLWNAALLLAVAATAAAWHHCRWHLCACDDLGCYATRRAQPVCVEARVVRMPRPPATPAPDPMRTMPMREGSRFDVDLLAIRDGSRWHSVSGRATLEVNGPPPEVHAGDRLRCFAHLSAPVGPQNPGAFDYAAYLRSEGIRSRLMAKVPQCVSVIQPGDWLSFAAILDRVRARSNRLFEEHLDPQRAELAEAVLLGEREQVDFGRTENFMATGTIHLLVIAGLHLGILAGAMFWIMQRTPVRQGSAMLLIAAATIFYVLLVDAGPSVVRAAVLVLVACAAGAWGRSPLSFNSLAAAALVVLAMNPNAIFHTGAQLSFLAVAGIMWFAPQWMGTVAGKDPLGRLILRNLIWLEWLKRTIMRSARHVTLISVTIWLLTMPLVMARFHLFTPIATFLNTVAWMPMALGLISGAVLLTIGSIAPPVARACGFVCNLNFWLMEWMVALVRRIPGSHFWVPGPADWWLWGFYGGLGLLATFPRIRPPRRWCVALLACWVTLGFAAAQWRHEHDCDRLDCTFLSVGHGCAALVELPSGQTLLYDAGRMGAPTSGCRTISEALWAHGTTHLDAVMLSHSDIDHYNALPGVLEKFSVGVVYVSPVMFDKENHAMRALRAAIERHGVPIREVCAGDRLCGGEGCTLEVLHPPPHGIVGSNNANSLVLSVEYRGRRILLTGDLESPGLDDLLTEEPESCDVLMAPHHGSRQSNLPKLAAWCKPRWVVFSGDGRWSVAEAEVPYREVGGQVLHTFIGGAINVRIDEAGIGVSEFVPPTTP